MTDTFLAQAIFIDTSAVVEIEDSRAIFHEDACRFLESRNEGIVWVSLNATTHETYTRIMYDFGHSIALRRYDWLRGEEVTCLSFSKEDEQEARRQLIRYSDQKLSFHDALLAVVMKRVGAYRVFSFDHDFFIFGFEVLPGFTR
jgi:predicted nucleic acid-binding protein